MITTKRLKERLQAGETLSFIYPGSRTDNSRDLTIVVKPTDKLPHEVFVEGILQYDIPHDSELYNMWFKELKNRNAWETKFHNEWRCLLSLNMHGTPDINDPNSELLYYIQDKVYQFYKRGKWSRKKWKLKWSKGPYNKKNDYILSHRRYIDSSEQKEVTRTYIDHKGKTVTRTHKFWVVKYDHAGHTIVMDNRQRPDKTFRYVMDMVTKAVEKVSVEIAKDLIERFEHYDYCTRRDYRHYMRQWIQTPLRLIEREEKDLYWKDEPFVSKDAEGKDVTYPRVFMPKVNPKDQIKEEEQLILKPKEHTRRERREHKHKQPLYDRHSVYQTIKIEPEIDEEGYIVQDKFSIRRLVFDYEYRPRFSNGKQFFDKNGDPIMKKYYVGKHYEDVTITEDARTTYKTIVTKQYPGDLSKKRGMIKRNIELLKQYQAESAKKEQEEKSE